MPGVENEILGIDKMEIDTPALLLDLDLFESNIKKMADFLRATGCSLRPHFKAHRTPEISKRQLEAGAIGVTCAKLAEAELLAECGMDDILIANEIAGQKKWRRLAQLAGQVEVSVGVDSFEAVNEISTAAIEEGTQVGLVVDVDIGMERCGVLPGEPALDLARFVCERKGVRLKGVMAYESHLVSLPRGEEKEKKVKESVALLIDSMELIRSDGIDVEIVSCGGTGTYYITGTIPGVTELQCGTYCICDVMFWEIDIGFERSMTVLSTIISRPSKDRAILDTGRKSLHPLRSASLVKDVEGAQELYKYSEHGVLTLEGAAQDLKISDKIELYPHYADGTVNLHDRFYCTRDGKLEDIWEISGRDKSR